MTQTATRGRHRHTPGMPCWASVMVRDLAGAQAFYRALFGWEFAAGPEQLGPYVRAVRDGREVAGLGATPADGRFPVAWVPYLASDDADATAELIRLCGGTVAVGPLDAGDTGRLVVAADPGGAVFGVWQGADDGGPDDPDTGLVGAPTWFELVTHAAAGPQAFYPSVFGYGVRRSAEDGDTSVTLCLEDHPVATVRGTGEGPGPEHGPHWKTCFAVPDAEASVRRTVELGGRLVRAPHRTPYGVRATVTDPEGAEFSLLEREPGA